MYHLAAEKQPAAGQILHVGDDLTTDVAGAIRCGMQACWIKPENADLMRRRQPSAAAHGNFTVGISDLADIITSNIV
jgi:putative hydrolase of the HAD superfamily